MAELGPRTQVFLVFVQRLSTFWDRSKMLRDAHYVLDIYLSALHILLIYLFLK